VLKILMVDDHAVVRSGVRQFLANSTDYRICGEAGSGHEALRLVSAESWDLVLLDIGLPDINGLEVLRRIKHAQPALPVLIFSMYEESDYAASALDAGATGYLPKDSQPEEILQAIRRGARGERYLSPAFADKLLAGTLQTKRTLPHERLSEREYTVLLMLGRGMSLTAIGEALHLSPKTVSTYRSRVLEKLGIGSNAELTRYIVEHRLDG
jgi:two-component system invasion response regulator UvrY